MPGPPIRKPSDHSPPAGSPRNIAGHHVLHRPLMPRHPPNAQKKQTTKTHEQNKKQFCRRNLTVRCSRPLYSSQPTHPHPPTTPNKSGAPDGSGNQGALPQNPDSMPPPHTQARGGTHHHPTGQQRACLSCQHQTSQPPARDKPHGTQSTARPFRKGRPPAGPDPSTIQTTHDQEATPHNQSLERR